MRFTYKFSATCVALIKRGKKRGPVYCAKYKKFLGDILIYEYLDKGRKFRNEADAMKHAKQLTKEFVWYGRMLPRRKKANAGFTHVEIWYTKESTGHRQML